MHPSSAARKTHSFHKHQRLGSDQDPPCRREVEADEGGKPGKDTHFPPKLSKSISRSSVCPPIWHTSDRSRAADASGDKDDDAIDNNDFEVMMTLVIMMKTRIAFFSGLKWQ